MTDRVDPWEAPVPAALNARTVTYGKVQRVGGPERFYDPETADPDWKPRPVGFAPPGPLAAPERPECEPLRWEGDDT